MSLLYLLRHGKAAGESPEGDAERPLAERGRREVRGVALHLAAPSPALVLCSPALRTRQTLDLLLPALVPAPRVLYEDGLYLAEARAVLVRLRQIATPDAAVLVVGHNPGLHELALLLVRGPAAPLREGFPTAALACFEVATPWSGLAPGQARLLRFETPQG